MSVILQFAVMTAHKQGVESVKRVLVNCDNENPAMFRNCETGGKKIRYHDNHETTCQLSEHKLATTGNQFSAKRQSFNGTGINKMFCFMYGDCTK